MDQVGADDQSYRQLKKFHHTFIAACAKMAGNREGFLTVVVTSSKLLDPVNTGHESAIRTDLLARQERRNSN